jgi:4-amino-4-deoxy-L-arabinose transferase-like glycosyltransferase
MKRAIPANEMKSLYDRPHWLLFVVSLILYAPGILWGVPYASAPDRIYPWGSDETAPLGPIAQVLHYVLHSETTLDPRYPLLPYVVQLLFMAPYLVFLLLTGGLAPGTAAEYPFGLADPIRSLATLTVLARLPSLLMAAALPPIAFATARTLWDRTTGLLAGAFVMVLYPLFFYSRTSNVDGHALFWTALSLSVVAAYIRQGLTRRRAILFGVFAALAVASKDQSYAVLGVIPAIVVVRSMGRHATPGEKGVLPILMAAAIGIVVYGVASGLVLNPGAFLSHIDFITHGSAGSPFHFSIPATPAGYARLLRDFSEHVVGSLGLPMTMAAIAGLALAAVRDRSALWLAVPVLGLLAGVIVPVRFVLFRFVLPAAWILALFAAYAVGVLAREQCRRPRSILLRGATITVATVIVGWSLLRGLDLTFQMLRDSRVEVASWLERNAQTGDVIGYYGSSAKLPAVPVGVATVIGPHQAGSDPGQTVAWPHFVLVIPQQPFEREHEFTLPENRYRELSGGAWNYDQIVATRTRSLFPDQPVTWVNPRVRVFARRDVVPRLRNRTPIDRIK